MELGKSRPSFPAARTASLWHRGLGFLTALASSRRMSGLSSMLPFYYYR